jgi:hypothetical protein
MKIKITENLTATIKLEEEMFFVLKSDLAKVLGFSTFTAVQRILELAEPKPESYKEINDDSAWIALPNFISYLKMFYELGLSNAVLEMNAYSAKRLSLDGENLALSVTCSS